VCGRLPALIDRCARGWGAYVQEEPVTFKLGKGQMIAGA